MKKTIKKVIDIHSNLSQLELKNDKNKYAAARNVKILQGIVDDAREKIADTRDELRSVDKEGFPFMTEDGKGFKNKVEDDKKISAKVKELLNTEVDFTPYQFSDNEEIRNLHVSFKILFEGFVPEDVEPKIK